ncbi:hypothetical protein [Dactylosporangium sp. CA-092794]|uniref:hypothetical protein n=1 Tax=Dactylosporangium sp. CA-092794 TaxID=3239929 RepID=UPI003D8BA046
MTDDHVGVMLDAVLAIAVPDGYTSVYRERHDTVINHTFRAVTVSPPGVDVDTFRFGTPGAYAAITVNDSGDTYAVEVMSTNVGYHVQRAGHVVAFTTADAAVCCAIGEIRDHLLRQQRGW